MTEKKQNQQHINNDKQGTRSYEFSEPRHENYVHDGNRVAERGGNNPEPSEGPTERPHGKSN